MVMFHILLFSHKMVVLFVKPFQTDQFCIWWLLLVAFHSETGMALNSIKNTKSTIPSVKIDFFSDIMSRKDVNKTNIKSLNEYLTIGKNTHETQAQTPYPQWDSNETQSSIIFEEISTLILTKASYKVTSYINFQPHIKTFEDTGKLLTETRSKIVQYLHLKRYPPCHWGLEGELLQLQKDKDAGIQVQLQDVLFETNLMTQNFELMAKRFTQITGYLVALPVTNQMIRENTNPRAKHSIVSKIFKFIFGDDDGNSKMIEVLKKNIERLFQNDQLQEKQLQELLKSQKLNTDEIQINRNLFRCLTKDLTQLNATLNDVSFGVMILFTMANFQVSINQIKHDWW